MLSKEEKQNYTKLYLELCERTFKNNHHFNITTLTMVFKVTTLIDIHTLYTLFDDLSIDKQISRNEQDFRFTKRHKLKKVFFNQITLSFRDWSKKVIKIFKNGSIHITGIASVYDFEMTFQMIMEWLNKYLEDEICQLDGSTRIVMINGSIDTGAPIKLRSYITTLSNANNEFIKVIKYAPEKYPAVNIKMANGCNAFVFRTGKVIMSALSLEQISEAYEHLDLHDVKIRPTLTIYNHTILGYGLKQFMNCVQ
jgi:TATA-box binding protein (TBP) (component of TFIID and TFIIIB)